MSETLKLYWQMPSTRKGLALALGLLVQGLFFAPFDLPQYGMNVTTLLVPLFALIGFALASMLASRDPARFKALGNTKG